MKTSRLTLVCILFTFIAALPAIAGPRTFVSGLGNDANPGTREQPKRTFASALTVTNPGGQIVALDSAGYGSSTLTIDKSVSIIVPPGVAGFMTVSGASNGITINAPSDAVVSLRGLIIETSSSGSGNGIRSNSVGTLTVEDCAIRNFGRGINFNQANAGHLQVHGGSVRGNTYGIYVSPIAPVALDAIVTGSLVENNSTGFYVNAGNGGPTQLTAAGCTISGNSTGIHALGVGGIIRVSDSTITDNSTGVSGSVFSRRNNTLENNANGNSFPGTYSAK